jgi:hypothetical protein
MKASLVVRNVVFFIGLAMQERRQCGRWQVNSLASVNVENRAYPIECQVNDISYKGLKIRTPRALEKDSIVRLNIALEIGSSLDLEASVVWNDIQEDGYHSGLCFTKIRDIDKEKIYSYVHSNFLEGMKQQVWNGVM